MFCVTRVPGFQQSSYPGDLHEMGSARVVHRRNWRVLDGFELHKVGGHVSSCEVDIGSFIVHLVAVVRG